MLSTQSNSATIPGPAEGDDVTEGVEDREEVVVVS